MRHSYTATAVQGYPITGLCIKGELEAREYRCTFAIVRLSDEEGFARQARSAFLGGSHSGNSLFDECLER